MREVQTVMWGTGVLRTFQTDDPNRWKRRRVTG